MLLDENIKVASIIGSVILVCGKIIPTAGIAKSHHQSSIACERRITIQRHWLAGSRTKLVEAGVVVDVVAAVVLHWFLLDVCVYGCGSKTTKGEQAARSS